MCGPVTDIELQMKSKYGDQMKFIHQEVWVDNDTTKGLREPLQQFSLPTEPWLFVVDKNGKITARLEGSIGVQAVRGRGQVRAVRRALAVLATALAVGALVPAVAEAHGLVQRQPLPIPQWLFAWAAAAVLVISFFALAVLWPQPRLERDEWRPLPGGRGFASPPVQVLCGAIGVGLLVVTVLAGYLGSGTALDNWAPTFLLITFWVGLVFASILFGDVYRAFSPFRAIGRLLPSLDRPYPERLGRWPAAVGLFVVHLDRARLGLGRGPGDARHRGRRLHRADAGRAVRLGRRDLDAPRRGVRRLLQPVRADVDLRDARRRARRAAARSAACRGSTPRPGPSRFVTVMIGTVTFDGLSQGQLWKDMSANVVDALDGLGIGALTASKIAATFGLLLGVGLVAGFYRLGIEGARSVGGGLVVPARSSTASSTRSCRSPPSTSPRTT